MGSRVLVARYFGAHEFGLLALGLSLIVFIQPLAELGLSASVPRFIGHYQGRRDQAGLYTVILTSLLVTASAGGVLSLSLFAGSDLIAQAMSAPDLAPVIRVLALLALLNPLSTVLLGVFRGFDRTREKLLFDDLVPNVLKIVLILGIILVHGVFIWVAGAYLLIWIVELVFLAVHVWRKIVRSMVGSPITWSVSKALIRFSLPLFWGSHLNVIGSQTNTVLLGFFLLPTDVGLYSAALLFDSTIGIFHNAMRYLYLPVTARLAGGAQGEDLKPLYSTVTKWVTAISFPIALLCLAVPETLLSLFFGETFIAATPALRILAFARLSGIALGPNAITLTALGHSREVFWGLTISNLLAITLSFVLIPTWGITGAALAAGTSVMLSNIYSSYKLYRLANVPPVSKSFLPVSAIMGVLVLSVFLTFGQNNARVPGPLLISALLLLSIIVSLGSTWIFSGSTEVEQNLWMMVRGRLRARTEA
jgi:O-antigen/teichoic acid export membrane protein